MRKYINDFGKVCWHNIEPTTLFDLEMFHVKVTNDGDDRCLVLHTNLGSITILDRLTGFSGGVRDTETGFRDQNGNFWLASGMMDVSKSSVNTIGEAIDWIKANANTCIPDLTTKEE